MIICNSQLWFRINILHSPYAIKMSYLYSKDINRQLCKVIFRQVKKKKSEFWPAFWKFHHCRTFENSIRDVVIRHFFPGGEEMPLRLLSWTSTLARQISYRAGASDHNRLCICWWLQPGHVGSKASGPRTSGGSKTHSIQPTTGCASLTAITWEIKGSNIVQATLARTSSNNAD